MAEQPLVFASLLCCVLSTLLPRQRPSDLHGVGSLRGVIDVAPCLSCCLAHFARYGHGSGGGGGGPPPYYGGAGTGGGDGYAAPLYGGDYHHPRPASPPLHAIDLFLKDYDRLLSELRDFPDKVQFVVMYAPVSAHALRHTDTRVHISVRASAVSKAGHRRAAAPCHVYTRHLMVSGPSHLPARVRSTVSPP
jgi:hypothetical protein